MNALITFLRKGPLLLTVIVIPFLLAALVVHALQSASITPSTGIANDRADHLKTAISDYFNEHKKYPAFDSAYDTDLSTDFYLMDILVGADHTLRKRKISPRRIAYYVGKEAKLGEDGRYREGLSRTREGQSELWDPWGNHYHVRLDTNHDTQLADPSGGDAPIPETILIWSAGPDGDFATWKDNIRTW